MGLELTDLLIFERNGDNVKASISDLFEVENKKYDLGGNFLIDNKIKNQYWNLLNDTIVTGTSLPPTGYSSNIVVYIKPNGLKLSLPSSWDILGSYNLNAEFNILVLELARYNPGAILNTSGYFLHDEILEAIPPLLRKYNTYTVGNLPTGLNTGALAVVTDANSIRYRDTVVGGGNQTALVMYDGSDWIYH